MPEWRRATRVDADALADLERDANLAALAHVFPSEEFPFPWPEVRTRWETALADEGVVVEVLDGPARLDAFVADDGAVLRHLAVHPDCWGSGLAREGVRRAVARGAVTLWCLVDNHRARGLYAHLGWRPTGRSRDAIWPPYPLELEYALTPR